MNVIDGDVKARIAMRLPPEGRLCVNQSDERAAEFEEETRSDVAGDAQLVGMNASFRFLFFTSDSRRHKDNNFSDKDNWSLLFSFREPHKLKSIPSKHVFATHLQR